MKSVIRNGFAAVALVSAAAGGWGCMSSQAPGLIPVSAPVEELASSDATVVIVRPSSVGEGNAFAIEDEHGDVLAYTSARSQFALHLAPGTRTLSLRSHGTVDVLDAQLAPGRTYYVMVQLRPTPQGPKWELVPLHHDDLASNAVKQALETTPLYRVDPAFEGRAGVHLASVPARSVLGSLVPSGDAHTLRIEDGR
jgi:hypothetical protein